MTVKAVYLGMLKRWRLFYQKKIYVSFGENCLPDNILDRYKLKVLTTPFSHGRSNVEYILQLEKENYKDFLRVENYQYELLYGKSVPRLKLYSVIRNDYHELHKNGIEFTHHDLIKHEKIRLRLEKRLRTLQALKGKKRFVILYHHRCNAGTDIPLLIQDLSELRQLYSTNTINSDVVLFTQQIISAPGERKLIYYRESGIHCFVFHTTNEWAGDNDDLLWARCDEDLVGEMIKQIKKL